VAHAGKDFAERHVTLRRRVRLVEQALLATPFALDPQEP
jgi:hypothetical protein